MAILKRLRLVVAALFLCAISALFLDFSKVVPTSWHVLAHLQITPAVLGMSAGILLFWVAATVLFGRVYCSTLCPLGILQDVFSRISKTVRGKKASAYRFRPEMKKTRRILLAIFLLSLVVLPFGVTILDPYSHFGRIMTSSFRPLYLFGNNLLTSTGISGRFHYQAIHVDEAAVLAALAALILIGILSVFFGRRYCNTICPVGTFLGILSKFSFLKIRLKDDCVSCGLCERSCKGECIDSKNKTVDASRCVACFNCLGTCKRNSILYTIPLQAVREPLPAGAAVEAAAASGTDRRLFLQWSVFSFFTPSLLASLGAARAPGDPSLPSGVSRIGYEKTAPILPPGAKALEHFQHHCTACHLCVSKCPANILRPSTTELGLAGFLQPIVRFDYGFCNYDCTICAEVCPSHALIPLDTEQKHRLQIGTVVFVEENCVVKTQETNCGACAEHCPSGAVKMIPYGRPEQHLTIPTVDPELCVGCGACEHICPVNPYRAIYVDGLLKHREAKLGYDPDAKQESVELDDFGF